MTRMICLLAALLLAGAATAQEIPALFDVTGLSPDQTLSVRENPRASAPEVGALPAGATQIEVVALSSSGRWGRINLKGVAGWVELDHLVPRPLPAAIETRFDAPLNCWGDTPMWQMQTLGDGLVTLSTPQNEVLSFTATGKVQTQRSQMLEAAGEDGGLTAMLRPELCRAGADGGQYGLQIDLLLRRDGAMTPMSGCCSLLVN